MSKRVIVKKRPRATSQFPVGVEVNLKVKGERAMRKHVTLAVHPSDPFKVLVKTGTRGRPAHLPVEQIERVRVL